MFNLVREEATSLADPRIAAPAEQREARNSPSCGRTYLSIDSEGLEPAALSYTHDARPARECVPDGVTIVVSMF